MRVSQSQRATRRLPPTQLALSRLRNSTIIGVATERLTISLEAGLAAAVREAAEADEQSVSAWLADAARRRLVTRGLLQRA